MTRDGQQRMRLRAWLCLSLLSCSPATAFGADLVDGTWGPVQAGGDAGCRGLAVLVLDQGRYYRVLPDVGSTGGVNQLILAHASYHRIGNRLVLAPALSFSDPQPRRIFLLQTIGGRVLIEQGRERTVFRPCPSLDPASLDAAVKQAPAASEQSVPPPRDRR